MASNKFGLFWNSVGEDRLYDADSFSEWLQKFFTNGVFANELEVKATTGLKIAVSKGYANIGGKVRFFDETNYFTLTPANTSYPRIDTVVIERNNTNREITMKLVVGDLSGNNPAPTLPVRNSSIHQLVLAEIYLPAGATKITQANIKDKRADSSVCGFVKGTVEELDVSQLVSQLNAKFYEWFNDVKGSLSGDVAANLQRQIGEFVVKIETLKTKVTYANQSINHLEQKLESIERKAIKHVLNYTLKVSDWDGNKAISINNNLITRTSKITIAPILTTSGSYDSGYVDYIRQLKQASILPFSQQHSRLKLLCLGEKPKRDLEIQLLIEGE